MLPALQDDFCAAKIVQDVIFSLCIDRRSMQMVEHQMIYSPKREKKQGHIKIELWITYTWYLMNSNLLTLSATDPPASRPKWVPPCIFSCLPYPCWVPTNPFLSNWVGLALHLPPSTDQFQGAVFSCRAQRQHCNGDEKIFVCVKRWLAILTCQFPPLIFLHVRNPPGLLNHVVKPFQILL